MSALHNVPRAAEIGALLAGSTAVGLLTAIYYALGITNPTISALSFLLVVLIIATVSTRWVAIATSLIAFVCFNFFFLPPVGTLTIAEPQNWVALFTLLAVSVVASHLSSQVRRRAQDAAARRDELGRLFDLTCDILLITQTPDAIASVARSIAQRFGLTGVTICLPEGDGWRLHHSNDRCAVIDSFRLDSALDGRARFEADRSNNAENHHAALDLDDGPTVWLVPLRVGQRRVGVLALWGQHIERGTRDAIAGVTAIAIERTQLLDARREADVVRRADELKSALLASLGHDLKTPLTAVTIAANNLDASWLTDDERREQVEIVQSELERLNRLFQDILEMARIETNAVAAEPEWVQANEIVEAAVSQVERALARHRLDVDVGSESELVRIDPRLTSAALAHLLENAGQYSPPDSTISVRASYSAGEFRITVRDYGVGIAPEDRDRLFDRFYRGTNTSKDRFGTGMGLAITRGLLAAEGGRVWADNHPEGGAIFSMAIPAESRLATALRGERV